MSGIGADRIVELRDDHADVVRLLGNETVALTGVDDGDVVVWGTWVADPGFVVSDFKVTTMHGRPALDGVLEATDGGFALRLKDGSFQALGDLSSACALYLGARIWVVGHDDGTDVQFGVIAGVSSPEGSTNKAASGLSPARRTLEGATPPPGGSLQQAASAECL